jgi:DNA-binding GntR family transcriptional regulator
MIRKKLHHAILAPLAESVQRADRAYEALRNGIINGEFLPGAQLNADSIAQQLKVSTTPVRDALNHLVKDGLVAKMPYQGWFVGRFSEQEIRDLYEIRAELECFAIRLACERITAEEIDALYAVQAAGELAWGREDTQAYANYNQEFHTGIMYAARNSQLPAVFGQISLKTQMLSAKTIRIGRASRGVQEHRRLIELIVSRDACTAQALMREHILSALEDILRHGLG